LLEAGKNADGQTGETGGKVSVCKETFLIRPPAREKSNYLSVSLSDYWLTSVMKPLYFEGGHLTFHHVPGTLIHGNASEDWYLIDYIQMQ